MIRICMALVLGMTSMAALAQHGMGAKESTGKNGKPVFRYVEQMPEPLINIGDFLMERMHYPDSALKYDIEGRVLVKFMIDQNGDVKDVGVDSSTQYGYGLEEEAIRVVRMMPRWVPGRQNGVKVCVYYTLPILFKLEDEDTQEE